MADNIGEYEATRNPPTHAKAEDARESIESNTDLTDYDTVDQLQYTLLI